MKPNHGLLGKANHIYVHISAAAGASSLRARFENLAKENEEETRKQAEEERARRKAREEREKEEDMAKEQVRMKRRPAVHNCESHLLIGC